MYLCQTKSVHLLEKSKNYFLLFGSRIFLRMRNDFGVISKYSSLSINSRAVSKVNLRGGISIIASSDALERTLVSFFSLIGLTLILSLLESQSLILIPTYTF